ncbi:MULTISPECIES: IS481 family transposase [unclassified Gordonia (in: high G+C Gram-positive bacteria)]
MSKARVVVLEVVSGRLTVTEAARTYQISRQHIYRLLARYREDGLEAVDPRSRRPLSNPRGTPAEVIDAIVTLRMQLTRDGLDAGPLTLQWHLRNQHLPVPSTSTIRRILHAHTLVTPQPRKRPKSSYRRFEASQPNECWQSDMTHWRLDAGADVEILSWLDDHSRYLLGCSAHRRVSGPDVVSGFLSTAEHHGFPSSTLTDNGSIYTSRFTKGHNDFERLLASLCIIQKNGHPGHPQSQGKIERFHRTLKLWLHTQPAAPTITDLQTQLDSFATIFNTRRPHRALRHVTTPTIAYHALPKAHPAADHLDHFRLRHDTVDQFGKLTLRHASRLHHLGIGRQHAATPVLILVTTTVIVVARTDHRIIASHHIDPDRNYWPNQQKNPGR